MPENNEILQISDGTTIISLIDPDFGFWLAKWNPAIADYKRGGTWQNSSLATGRRLVQKKFENVIEKMIVKLVAEDEELGIENLQKILRLFEKASDYWTTDWQDEMVWIEARGACETNSRFAIIHRGRIPDLQDPYGQPWFGGLLDRVTMEDLSVIIERGDWLATQPGTTTCVQVSNTQDWAYTNKWEENTTLPTQDLLAIIQVANGDIYATGGTAIIIRSVDDGENWAVNLSGAPLSGVPRAMAQAANGDIYVGAINLIKSDDNGVSWTNSLSAGVANIHGVIQLSSGDIIAVGEETGGAGAIWRSNNNGAAWVKVFDGSGAFEDFQAIVQTQNGTVIAGNDDGKIFISEDNGVTWTFIKTTASTIFDMILASDNNVYQVLGDSSVGQLWWSQDNGSTWQKKYSTVEWEFQGIMETDLNSGEFYIIARTPNPDFEAVILRSNDYGVSFNLEANIGGSVTLLKKGIIQTSDGKIYAGIPTEIYRTDPSNLANLGREVTCTNELYVANKTNIANLTHIKLSDGGVFTDLFPMTTFPQNLLPAAPATNDAIYFGIESVVTNSGPFSGMAFDIGTPAAGLLFNNIWEYYNGSWVTLTSQDNTDNGQGGLTAAGVNSIHWEQPADWITVAIDGITAYWVRARVSSLTGTMTTATQQNREIYALINAYTDIVNTEVLGDTPSLSKIQIQNQSDKDGRNGSAPDLWSNRIIVGLRSYDRGNNFQAFLNASDEQNPAGVTVTAGADGSFIDDITAPTGRAISFDPAASATIAAAVTFALSPSIARDFYGKFHAFVRGNMLGGITNEVGIRLQVINGSGGITFTTETKFFQSIADWELIDLGRITIPVGGVLKPTDLGDQTQLIIQASTTSGIYAPDVRIYDLVLIPVDEWAGDFVDGANTADSIIGRNNDLPKYLDVDSITNPKAGAIQSLVRIAGSDLITSIYNLITPGEAILQANAQQRLWFLSARTSATGTDFQWISEPWVSHSVQLFSNCRYLSMRGNEVATIASDPIPASAVAAILGYFAGGSADSGFVATTDQITFSSGITAANAVSNLSVARDELSGLSDTVVYGYFAGGDSGSRVVTADRITFSSGVTAANAVSDLSAARDQLGELSDGSVYGYFAGGNTGSRVATTDRITFSSGVTAANAVSDLSGARDQLAGLSDNVKWGYFGGGFTGSFVAITDRITFSSGVTAANAVSDLSAARDLLGGLSDGSIYGYWAGGGDGGFLATADRITFSSGVTAANAVSDLSQARSFLTALSDGLNFGYFGGGWIGDFVATVDRITFSTGVTAANAVSDLSVARSGLAGLSDGAV